MPGWIHEWLIFVGVMALGQFSPGADMLLLTRTALASGRVAGCAIAFGIACGLAFHSMIAVTGVAVVLWHGGWLGRILPWAAALYLLWLAIPLIGHGLKRKALVVASDDTSDSSITMWAYWKRGLFCNLFNPKVAVFLAGVVAPFLLIQEPPVAWPAILWLTIVLEGLILWCAWAIALQHPTLKNRYLRAAHWFDLAFGIALVIVAVILVI